MPVCDASEFHETTVHAPIEKVYDALRTANLGDSPIIRLLLRLRELPATLTTGGRKRNLKLNLDAIIKGGFVLLGENPPNEIALGLVGRFWTLSGSRCRVNAGEFASFDLPGYAKAFGTFLSLKRARNSRGSRPRRGCDVWIMRADGASAYIGL